MTTHADIPNGREEPPPPDPTMLARLWAQFDAAFPTDADARQELTGIDELSMPNCKHCRSAAVMMTYANKVIHCSDCKKKTWLTADTFFQSVRRPRAWLGAIWLLERGIVPSLLQFHKLAGVAYSTAWNIFKKLTMVIEYHIPDHCIKVDSSLFSLVVSRRSRETPAHAHPTAEIENPTISQDSADGPSRHAESESSQNTAADEFQIDLTELEKGVRDLLATEPLHFDTLLERSGLSAGQLSAALTMLEFSDAAIRMAGDRYARRDLACRQVLSPPTQPSSSSTAQSVSGIIESSVSFFRRVFHGISRKYLQLFLALNWCRVDRVGWHPGSLLTACRRCDQITEDEVLAYVSPSLIKTSH